MMHGRRSRASRPTQSIRSFFDPLGGDCNACFCFLRPDEPWVPDSLPALQALRRHKRRRQRGRLTVEGLAGEGAPTSFLGHGLGLPDVPNPSPPHASSSRRLIVLFVDGLARKILSGTVLRSARIRSLDTSLNYRPRSPKFISFVDATIKNEGASFYIPSIVVPT